MKIERKDNNNIYDFWQISIGDVFVFEEDVYIKIDDTNDLNAINLILGCGDWFEPCTKVREVDATLVIE